MRLQAFFLGIVTLSSMVSAAAVKTNKQEADTVLDTKYFHEPGTGELTGHYDARFFQAVQGYDERLDTLKHLAKSWLQVTAKEDIETWIAHGTLLGWWWNGNILPWDWDLDVQVSAKTLNTMGEKYNMSRHHYTSDDGSVEREYLLDVNPWIWERVRGDGNNVIDARWIDVRNGLYVDITGIAETKPAQPGVLNCKNYHFYRVSDKIFHLPVDVWEALCTYINPTDDIWPLRDTLFEGVPAKIPYNFDEVLMKEYKTKALVVTEYEGHRWNTQSKTWDKADDVPAGEGAKPLMNMVREPEKYSMIETGGFFYNTFRLLHWW